MLDRRIIGCPESAGQNRLGAEDERALQRRSSDPRWLRVMRHYQ